MNILIIGYGNTLRNDDGVGVRVAEIIEGKNYPDTRVITAHQLTPELSEDIAGCDLVIFVDAVFSDRPEIQIENLESSGDWKNLGHAENPRSLLAFTRSIYQKTPIARGVYIPAVNCDFGEELSEVTSKGMEGAIKAIGEIIHSYLPG
ncbi:hydrogenase maturation protease [Pannus brasiliensis CCIBt3594]|uniref:Hydrogenase maturation protease n=1 Tax=Pannus brasiliensis CCIBt3594 TaxID=1427578 RepID=A0AAW9QJQ3_9CHRO